MKHCCSNSEKLHMQNKLCGCRTIKYIVSLDGLEEVLWSTFENLEDDKLLLNTEVH